MEFVGENGLGYFNSSNALYFLLYFLIWCGDGEIPANGDFRAFNQFELNKKKPPGALNP